MTAERLRRYREGLWAETAAAWRLRLKGYRILARRFKTSVGEIDLVALRGKTLVFVEVKRRASHDEALFAVTPKAQKRIARAAELYRSRHPKLSGHAVRFDIVAVTPLFRIIHLDNAFRGPA